MESFDIPGSGKFPRNFFKSGEFLKNARRIGEPMFFQPGEFFKWLKEEKAKSTKENEGKGENNIDKPEAA